MTERKRLYEVKYAGEMCRFSKTSGYGAMGEVAVWATDAEDAVAKLRESGETVVHVEYVTNVIHPLRVIM